MKKQYQNKNILRKPLPRAWRAAFERLDTALRENTTRINNARKIAILRKIALANAEHLKPPTNSNGRCPSGNANNSQSSITNSQPAILASDS